MRCVLQCLAATAALVCFVQTAHAAKTFKGVLDAEGTITFYYDEVDHASEGTVHTQAAGNTGYPPWKNDTSILKAVFTPSCSSCAWTKGLQYFFLGCSNLTTVEGLENVNATSASSFYQMFKDCSSLVSIDSETLESPNVTNFGDMFYGCSSLESLDISSLSSASAGQCGNMFRGCSSLTTIYVRSGFDLSSLGSQWVFTSASKLVGGNGTKFSNANVHASYARIDSDGSPGYFTLKTQTLTLDVTEFAGRHIASAQVANASDGTSIEPDEVGGSVWTLPKGTAVTIAYTAVDGYEFDGQPTHVDARFAAAGILKNEVLGVDELPAATAFARHTLTVDMSDFEAQHVAEVIVVDTTTGAALSPSGSGTYSLVPGRGFTISYRATPGYLFPNYVSVTNNQTYAETGIMGDMTESVTPRASVTMSGIQIKGVVSDADPTTMTFYCDDENHVGIVYARKALTGIPSWANLSSVTRVVIDSSMRTNEYGSGGDGFQYMFYGMSSVTNIEGLSNLKTSNAKNFTQMFMNCRALADLDLSTFRTPNAKHFGEMFRYCSSLKTLDISRFSCGSDVGAGFMFNGCAKLTTIYVNAKFDLGSVATDDYMFTGCSSLVGGNGTKAITNIQHYRSYAHVDEPGNPGYFTLKPFKGCCVIFR